VFALAPAKSQSLCTAEIARPYTRWEIFRRIINRLRIIIPDSVAVKEIEISDMPPSTGIHPSIPTQRDWRN